MELKRDDEAPRKLQEYIHRTLLSMGCEVQIIRTKDQFDAILDKMGALKIYAARSKVVARPRRRWFMV